MPMETWFASRVTTVRAYTLPWSVTTMLYLACSEMLTPTCYHKVKKPNQPFPHTPLPVYHPVLPISQNDAFMVPLLNVHEAQIQRLDLALGVLREAKPPASTCSAGKQSHSPVFTHLLLLVTSQCAPVHPASTRPPADADPRCASGH